MFDLRPFQIEALKAIEKHGHVLCVAPTGSGKSRIYERWAARPGVRTILITPLVALGRQQRIRLHEAGVGESSVRILNPESLEQPTTRKILRDLRPNFLVVDECHCLWDWGEGFRPAFLRCPELLREFSIHRSLWLTATLPARAREHLRIKLSEAAGVQLHEQGRFELPESLQLLCSRVPWERRADVLLARVLPEREPGIVFVPTREGAARVARLLAGAGKRVELYHAGLAREERCNSEGRIQERLPEVVVATSAFGMGMDHSHLRWAVLWQAPPSLLSLAQAVGRVGRGGQAARADVFWDPGDFRLLEWTARGAPRRSKELLDVLRFLETPGCPRRALEGYFNGNS